MNLKPHFAPGTMPAASVSTLAAPVQEASPTMVPPEVGKKMSAAPHLAAVRAVVARMHRRIFRRVARFPRWAFTAFMLIVAVGSARAWEQEATLQAINQLENPRNLAKPGPLGELGAYQFRANTWRMHTNVPFERAIDRRVSDEVAAKHYAYLKRGLERAGLPATPYNIALAWNSGLRHVVKGTAPRVAHNYAERASNLAEVFASRSRLAAR